MKNLLLALIAVASLGGLGYFFLSSSEPDWSSMGSASIENDEDDADVGAGSEMRAEGRGQANREEVEADGEEVMVAFHGRVIDSVGKPVVDALVALAVREGRGRGRGNGEDAQDAGGRRGRRGGRDQGGRGQAGGRGQRGQRGQRGRGRNGAAAGAGGRGRGATTLPGGVKTDAEGRYLLRGYTAARGSVELQVDHEVYVKKTVRVRRVEEENEQGLEDIKLVRAANVRGVVVDERGRPVAAAEVKLSMDAASMFESMRAAGGFAGFGRQGQGQGQNGGATAAGGRRGGRGAVANAGDQGRGGRFGGMRDAMEQFRSSRGMPSVTTDEEGRFEILRVPTGAFYAKAEADKHLPARSESFSLQEGDVRGDLRIQLPLGSAMKGLVLDTEGNPVVGAEVLARWTPVDPNEPVEESAEAGEAEGGRGRGRGRRGGEQDAGGNGRGRGARGLAQLFGRGGRGGGFGGMFGNRDRVEELTKTDKDGRFDLDSLPPHEFRLSIEHEDFVAWREDEITVAKTPFLEVRLDSRLFISGLVVDKATGQPVEKYGIVARRVRTRGEGGRGRRGGGNGRGENENEDPAAAARRAERDAEREAQRAVQTAYLQSRLGATGRTAGETPEPTSHPQGKFVLDRLMPGDYVIDVHGDGYVRVAAASVKLEKGKELEPLTLQVNRGSLLEGVIVHMKTGEPIARAQVELILPPAPGSNATADQGQTESRADRFRNLINRARGGRGRGRGNRDTVLAEARTDKEGRFSFDRQLPGSYQIKLTVRGFPEQEKAQLDLGTEDVTDMEIVGRPGARVFGRVIDVEAGERATVTLTHEDGSTESGRVDRETMEYEVNGLKDGAYWVSVATGREAGRGRGGRGGGRGGRRGGGSTDAKLGNPDVRVTSGDEVRFDASQADPDYGIVAGFVTLNNAPASGFSVSLRAKRQAQDTGNTGRGRGGFGGRGGANLSARVGEDGAFKIQKVPPGDYTLSVTESRGRGGRGGRGGFGGGGSGIHSEEIAVVAAQTSEARVTMATGQLEIEFLYPPKEEGARDPRVSMRLALATEAAGKEPKDWNKLSSYSSQRPRSGKISVANFKVGTYAYYISGRGVVTVTGQLTVAGGASNPQRIPLELGKGEDLRATAMFDRLDKNKDKQLSKEELGRLSGRLEAQDKDGNGTLSREEFDAAMSTLGGRRGGRGGANGGGRAAGGRNQGGGRGGANGGGAQAGRGGAAGGRRGGR